MNRWQTKDVDAFYRAILSLKTPEECAAFLEDVCTIRELLDLSQRLRVAGMLRGGASYSAISAETGVSAATISRVSKCLEYGTGGYDVVLSRTEGKNDPGNKREK